MAAVAPGQLATAGVRAIWRGLQHRTAWTAQRRALPARRRRLLRAGLEPKSAEQRKWALITISGQTFASSGNDIWCGIADVMGRVGANIEDAAGTSMPSPALGSSGATKPDDPATPTCLVSAFQTHIAPFSLPLAPSLAGAGSSPGIAVAIFIKASIVESSVPVVTNLLHTRFPGLVCTVTVGGTPSESERVGAAEALVSEDGLQRAPTATVRLFGNDQVGQLARIAEVLHNCRVTILSLLVTIGIGDSETGDFVERVGGMFSENVITIAAFDQESFNEATVRKEVEVTAPKVGYKITSIILDTQESRAQELAAYYLQRKAFMMEVSQAEAHQGPLMTDESDRGGAG